jgi:hypothetical protein
VQGEGQRRSDIQRVAGGSGEKEAVGEEEEVWRRRWG